MVTHVTIPQNLLHKIYVAHQNNVWFVLGKKMCLPFPHQVEGVVYDLRPVQHVYFLVVRVELVNDQVPVLPVVVHPVVAWGGE